MQQPSQKNMKIYYVYDALCGWCYGFSPVMERTAERLKNEVAFEVLSGGMITDSRIGPIGTVAPYIRQAYRTVEEATGVRFGEKFLNGPLKTGKPIFTSIPAGWALTTFKTLRPEAGIEAVRFAGALQKAVYFEGIEPADPEAYKATVEAFGFDWPTFKATMTSDSTQTRTEREFAAVARLGVSGFPTLIGEDPTTRKLTVLAHGYTDENSLRDSIQAWQARTKQ
jgi:putative protein-disulfide isomerase